MQNNTLQKGATPYPFGSCSMEMLGSSHTDSSSNMETYMVLHMGHILAIRNRMLEQ